MPRMKHGHVPLLVQLISQPKEAKPSPQYLPHLCLVQLQLGRLVK